jgi:hypothetical protein
MAMLIGKLSGRKNLRDNTDYLMDQTNRSYHLGSQKETTYTLSSSGTLSAIAPDCPVPQLEQNEGDQELGSCIYIIKFRKYGSWVQFRTQYELRS